MALKEKSYRVQLTHPRVLHDGGKHTRKALGKGKHTLTQGVYDHWFTQALLESGDISLVVDEAKKAPVVAPGKKPKPVIEQDSGVEPGEQEEESEEEEQEESGETDGDDSGEESDEAPEGEPKKKKKKKAA